MNFVKSFSICFLFSVVATVPVNPNKCQPQAYCFADPCVVSTSECRQIPGAVCKTFPCDFPCLARWFIHGIEISCRDVKSLSAKN